MTHLLIEQDGAKRTIKTGCGIVRPRRPQDPLPDDVSAWGSDTTCPTCLARRAG